MRGNRNGDFSSYGIEGSAGFGRRSAFLPFGAGLTPVWFVVHGLLVLCFVTPGENQACPIGSSRVFRFQIGEVPEASITGLVHLGISGIIFGARFTFLLALTLTLRLILRALAVRHGVRGIVTVVVGRLFDLLGFLRKLLFLSSCRLL